MASYIWRISVKMDHSHGVKKGMFVEYIHDCSSTPLGDSTRNKKIWELFYNKYGIDMVKAQCSSSVLFEQTLIK